MYYWHPRLCKILTRVQIARRLRDCYLMHERTNRPASEPFSISQGRFSPPRLLTNPAVWYRAAMLLAVALFVHSLLSAGPVWDEVEEFTKLSAQLSFAGNVLSGATGLTFHSLLGDYAYYGAGTVFFPTCCRI
jgi:hypothetical protein